MLALGGTRVCLGLSQGGSGTHHRGRMGVLVLSGHGMCCQSTGHPVEGMSQPSAPPERGSLPASAAEPGLEGELGEAVTQEELNFRAEPDILVHFGIFLEAFLSLG